MFTPIHYRIIFLERSGDLLERSLGEHTQNAKKSFNSTVWCLVPKHLHCGIKIIATVVFNEGYYAELKVMNMLDKDRTASYLPFR